MTVAEDGTIRDHEPHALTVDTNAALDPAPLPGPFLVVPGALEPEPSCATCLPGEAIVPGLTRSCEPGCTPRLQDGGDLLLHLQTLYRGVAAYSATGPGANRTTTSLSPASPRSGSPPTRISTATRSCRRPGRGPSRPPRMARVRPRSCPGCTRSGRPSEDAWTSTKHFFRLPGAGSPNVAHSSEWCPERSARLCSSSDRK